MKARGGRVILVIDRKVGLLGLAMLAVFWGGYALSEQLTLMTSYPVPSGIYNQLITTGNAGSIAADTTFNRNAGNTILVPPTNVPGSVGIGTTAPVSKLSVAGGVQMGDDAAACSAAKAGTQRWHAGSFQGCNGTAWTSLSNAAGSPVYSISCTPIGSGPTANAVHSITAGPNSIAITACTIGGADALVNSRLCARTYVTAGCAPAGPMAANVVQDGVSFAW